LYDEEIDKVEQFLKKYDINKVEDVFGCWFEEITHIATGVAFRGWQWEYVNR
jgi:hypothetical protein